MNYYAVERSTDHLAHYGVKGMRWGVRKAIARENEKALDRHYRKAAKKLAKLQDIGLNSPKYAAKSAAYGAAAVGTGTLAVGGTGMLGNLVTKPATTMAAYYAKRHDLKIKPGVQVVSSTKKNALYKKYNDIANAPDNIKNWGKVKISKDKNALTNNDLYRAGVGLAALGLAAKSAQNAYRASHGAKYRAKAHEFKTAMDQEFAGTKYAGHYSIPPKKRRRKSK